MKNYFDLHYTDSPSPSFCYRSGKTVYEEMLIGGALVACGWNDAGYPLNLLEKCSTRLDKKRFAEPYAFNIELDGQSLDYGLEKVDFRVEKSEENLTSTLILRSRYKPLEIRVHTLLDGTAMFTRYLEIENLSDSCMNLSRLSVMSGGIEITETDSFAEGRNIDEIYSLGYFCNDSWGREGEFIWKKLTPEITSIDTRFHRDRFRHPLLFIRNNLTGKIWFMQTAFSGGCRFTVDYNAHESRSTTRLSFKAEIMSHKPMLVLKPYETFRSPEVHIGSVFGDIDEAVNEMHSHIRKSVLNLPEADGSEALIGCGMGAEHNMTVETSKSYIRQFAEMGGEVFIVDAGWECPPGKEGEWSVYNGRNIPDKDRYPNGLKEISDYTHEKGMKFGLWVDIENAGESSGLHETHPEWFSVNPFGEMSPKYLDMSIPEVAQWAESELERIIKEYELDLLRVDHNVDYTEYFGIRENEAGIAECVSIRHINAVYKMYENLKKKFPHVIFENCAGGGGRTDLGMMKNFNHSWVSDCQCAPCSILITNGMTMALPPERVDRLFAGMGCHSYGSFDLQMRNCMLGHMSLNVVAPPHMEVNSEQMEFIRHSVDLYKTFIRPFLSDSKIFHQTPDLRKSEIAVIEIASSDSQKGAIGIFALSKIKGEKIIKAKGASLNKNYKITLDNERVSFKVSGRELKQTGIAINMPSAMCSELLLYEESE